jgi:D-glycero-beta-D-manno-heptose-7-phosphate kinase
MPGRDYLQLFEQFRHLKVMVIGDVMVDAYIFGKVDRISPEAPVPVVSVTERVNRLGGAANVALNLKALGAEPVLCSVIGDDIKGKEFLNLLNYSQISGEAIIVSKERKTTTKYRVIGNKAQMLRVDEEDTFDLFKKDQDEFLEKVLGVIEKQSVHAIVFQDYNKGVLTPAIITKVISQAKKFQIPVAVDPKKKNFNLYKGVSLFKPNLKEFREGLGIEASGNLKDLGEAASQLHFSQDIELIMITLSDEGVFISKQETGRFPNQHLVPAHKRNVADVSGAGDTVISVAALCLASRMTPVETASLSNLAGGLVCEEIGVAPVDREKLLKEARNLL